MFFDAFGRFAIGQVTAPALVPVNYTLAALGGSYAISVGGTVLGTLENWTPARPIAQPPWTDVDEPSTTHLVTVTGTFG